MAPRGTHCQEACGALLFTEYHKAFYIVNTFSNKIYYNLHNPHLNFEVPRNHKRHMEVTRAKPGVEVNHAK